MVGKWHLGFCNKKFWPNSRGFDSFYGFLNGGEGYYDHARYALTGIGGYDFRDGEDVAWEANGTYSTHLFQQRAEAIISGHAPDTPMFLYLAFQSVHGPLEVPAAYTDLYPGRAVNETLRNFKQVEV